MWAAPRRWDVVVFLLAVLGVALAACFVTGFAIGFLLLPALGALLVSALLEDR
jgi:hypothetical protein